MVEVLGHQLLGPLGGIRAALGALSDGDFGKVPPQAARIMRMMEQAAKRLMAFSETLLNSSRIEAGVYQSHAEPANIRSEVREAIRLVKPRAEDQRIRVTSDIAQNIPKTLSLDVIAFQNGLFNYLDNAVKYTSSGRVSVSVCTKGSNLCVDVADTGMGIPPKERRQLFQKFCRGEDATLARKGLGLGLFVVKHLIGSAGGTVNATSAGKGRGSTFSFCLPVEELMRR